MDSTPTVTLWAVPLGGGDISPYTGWEIELNGDGDTTTVAVTPGVTTYSDLIPAVVAHNVADYLMREEGVTPAGQWAVLPPDNPDTPPAWVMPIA